MYCTPPLQDPLLLRACYLFPGPVKEVVAHYNNTVHAHAQFQVDFYRVLMSDSTFTDCPDDGEHMVNGEIRDLRCGLYEQVHDDDDDEDALV